VDTSIIRLLEAQTFIETQSGVELHDKKADRLSLL
jgi:hypothetical protein